jgi:hypothetical protein
MSELLRKVNSDPRLTRIPLSDAAWYDNLAGLPILAGAGAVTATAAATMGALGATAQADAEEETGPGVWGPAG